MDPGSRLTTRLEVRTAPNGTGGTDLLFTGYASVTETPYEMQDAAGPYTEVVRAGAFKKTIADGCDTVLLVNHDGVSLARTKPGTLRLAEDSTGLHTEARLDPTSPLVQGIRSAIERNDIDEMSMGFWCVRQDWSPDFMQRDLLELKLHHGDVSIVNFGANGATAGSVELGKADGLDDPTTLALPNSARMARARLSALNAGRSSANDSIATARGSSSIGRAGTGSKFGA
jgi:HK97 family phage prohead protease